MVPALLGYGAGMTGALFHPDDMSRHMLAFAEQRRARLRVLLDGPCGRQVFAALLVVFDRDPSAQMTKAEITERTEFGEPTVRNALDRAVAAELVTVERRRNQLERHRRYTLTPAGAEFARQLAARTAAA